MATSGKPSESAARGHESSGSIDPPKTLGTNNVSMVTKAKTDKAQDFGKVWEKTIETQHDQGTRKPRKLIFLADSESF